MLGERAKTCPALIVAGDFNFGAGPENIPRSPPRGPRFALQPGAVRKRIAAQAIGRKGRDSARLG